MDWVMSEGGPLICIERSLAHLWGGVDRLTIDDPVAACDYERACVTNDYVWMVPLTESIAMTLGAPPVESYFRNVPSGRLVIVQSLMAEADFNLDDMLPRLDESIFDKPKYLTEWHISSSPLVLFDSAIPGEESDGERLTCEIRPGRHLVRSQIFELDADTSCLLHRFDPID